MAISGSLGPTCSLLSVGHESRVCMPFYTVKVVEHKASLNKNHVAMRQPVRSEGHKNAIKAVQSLTPIAVVKRHLKHQNHVVY